MECVFFFGALQRTPRYFEALLFPVEAAALGLVCATVTVAEVGVRGIVVVMVTVTTGAAEGGAREGVEEGWVVVVPVLVLVAITSGGWSRDGVGVGVAARARVEDAAPVAGGTGGGVYGCAALVG